MYAYFKNYVREGRAGPNHRRKAKTGTKGELYLKSCKEANLTNSKKEERKQNKPKIKAMGSPRQGSKEHEEHRLGTWYGMVTTKTI